MRSQFKKAAQEARLRISQVIVSNYPTQGNIDLRTRLDSLLIMYDQAVKFATDDLDLVKKVREAQKAYFESQPGPDKSRLLAESKNLEQQLDQRLQDIESGQTKLFDDGK